MEGCFVKKWTFPAQNETKLVLDLFFILHFTYLGECVRTPCLQACHIGNPYAFGMEHQSYFLHRLSWVSLSAILPSYAPISTFWGPRHIFGADKDSHFQVCVQIYRNRRGQTLKHRNRHGHYNNPFPLSGAE